MNNLYIPYFSLIRMPEKENLKDKISKQERQMTKEEQVAYHQGALNTLMGERNELIKMIQNVDAFIGMHVENLKKLGVKFQEKN